MSSFAVRTMVFAAVVGIAIGSQMRAPTPASAPKPAAAATTAAESWDTPHSSAGSVVIPRGMAGHFFVGGDVRGKPLHFVIDTGATTVAMSREEARSVGIDVDHLTFDQHAQTASGIVPVASVTLPALRVGDIQLLDVRASVMDMPGDIALLGQSFLGRIDEVSIKGDTMTLTKL